jgi:exodeoxyribonuclease VII small subunit
MAKKADPSPDGTSVSADEAGTEQAGERPADEHADVAALSYEQARDELVDIVARLENGQVGLEESMGLWARGEALAAHCARWLDSAEARIAGGD